jgi:hypothetical protein
MANDIDDGKLEMSIRILGNELIAIKMEVNDFKMKWLVIGVATLVGLGYAVSSFGPKLMDTFGGMV